MTDITIRPANVADLDRIYAIMCDDPMPDLLAIEPRVERARRIGALTIRNGLDIDLARTVLAIVDGQAVGLLETSRPGETSSVSPLAVLRVLVPSVMISGPRVLASSVRYHRARSRVQVERPKDAYYIGELDVHPQSRNRGIGARLMAYAEEQARTGGFARMALTSGITNPAQHLYVRSGFRIAESRSDAAYERITGIPGRMLMVKDLAY